MATPTSLRGYVDDQLTWGSLLSDVNDTVPDCLWPSSNETYRQMRRHPQLASILAAYSLPIRRASTWVNPAGCRDEVVQLCADDVGVPIAGRDTPGAARVRGVSWSDHLRLALLSVPYGHSGFEMRAEIRDGQARLVELSERLPSTISEIHTDKVGRFAGVTQLMSKAPTGRAQIAADRLVWYAREREGAAWWGQSLLRPAYPAWLLSREMLRVSATGHRRFSVGVPTGEWDANADPSPAQHTELQQAMSATRVGETGGLALPPGAHMKLVGLTGSVPDTLGFIRYLDQTMSRMALTGFLDLGTTETGSRALASEFIDLFMLAIQAEADAVADTATRQINARLVAWNWGEDEPVPAIQIADVGSKHEVTAEALNLLLGSGALSADPALEAHVRRQFKLPEREGMAKPAPTVQGDTVAAANRPRARSSKRKEPAPGQLALPIAAAAGDEPLPDYEQIQADWEQARAEMLEQWPDLSAELVAALAVAAGTAVAGGALLGLASLTAAPVLTAAAVTALTARMATLAGTAATQAAAEVTALGRTAPAPTVDPDRIEDLAAVFVGQAAAGYASAAGRRALQVSGPDATVDAVAEAVTTHLDEMSTTRAGLVADAFGAAMSAAQNTGRAAVLSQIIDLIYAADETLDSATCQPCRDTAGTEWATWSEAVAVYPLAGNRSCLGGAARCRGMIRAQLPS